MPHSYLSMPASTFLRPIIARAKSIARLPTADNGLNFLGSTVNERKNQTVYLANEVQRQLLDRFPVFNIRTTTKTTATAAFNLPSTMRGADILMAVWSDAATEIDIVTQSEFMLLSDKVRAYGATSDRPSHLVLLWTQSEGNGQGQWYPAPSDTTLSATIFFRARPSPFTIADLTTDNVVSAIPDEMIDTYALLLAAEFLKRNLGRTHPETQSLVAEAENMVARWQYQIAKSLSQRMQEALGRSKYMSESQFPPPHDFWAALRNAFTETNPQKPQG